MKQHKIKPTNQPKKEAEPKTVDIQWETDFYHLTPLLSYSLYSFH